MNDDIINDTVSVSKEALYNEISTAKYIILYKIFNIPGNVTHYSAITENGTYFIDVLLYEKIKDLKQVKQIVEDDYNTM